ncbi:MAG: TolB family protein [Tenacibaculum sp.]
MSKTIIVFLIMISFWNCKTKNTDISILKEEIPKNIPLLFKQNIVPTNKLIHKGILSLDLKEYYYTISDFQFDNFDVFVIKNNNGTWSKPKKAFFNSEYNEHGMSFSPDGNTIYFSSTRPTNIKDVANTWHIWKSEKVNGVWEEPTFVDIPNLRKKLVSHPTITNSGTLYFHSSNLDYTKMDIYHSKKENGNFKNAEKTLAGIKSNERKCTPYISPNEDYLIYASVNNELDLMITYNDGKGNWINTKKLNKKINNKGQGNPYVTANNKFLFFTTGNYSAKDWKVKWVNIESEIKNK